MESEEIKELERQLESDTQKMENNIRTKEEEMMSELDETIHDLQKFTTYLKIKK